MNKNQFKIPSEDDLLLAAYVLTELLKGDINQFVCDRKRSFSNQIADMINAYDFITYPPSISGLKEPPRSMTKSLCYVMPNGYLMAETTYERQSELDLKNEIKRLDQLEQNQTQGNIDRSIYVKVNPKHTGQKCWQVGFNWFEDRISYVVFNEKGEILPCQYAALSCTNWDPNFNQQKSILSNRKLMEKVIGRSLEPASE